MSPSLHVSKATKNRLSRLKRDSETWDEYLSRLVHEEEPIDIGSWSDGEAERTREAVKRSRESFEQ